MRRHLGLLPLVLAACTSQGTPTPLRSLERGGRISVLCLGPTGQVGGPGLPLGACSSIRTEDPLDFVSDEGTTVPHLYALVTQETRGEVAVIDLTAAESNVLDVDVTTPGSSFLPVGGAPTDLASTPGGMATFVAVADPGREGLFALPSAELRPCRAVEPVDGAGGAGGAGGGGAGGAAPRGCVDAPPTFTSWPACSLPAAPGRVLVTADPPDAMGRVRTTCDGAYEEPAPLEDPLLDLGREGLGAQKLVVTLPALGGLVVVDAQALLSRPRGSFDECPVERWVPLETQAPEPPPPSDPAPNDACVVPAPAQPDVVTVPPARPLALAKTGDRLFVGDLAAPVIHVLRAETPCEPDEEPPLLPRSEEDPTRLVTTSQLAVTPAPTTDLKRFLYAVDADEGSIMVFDVSDGSTSRVPLRRPDAALLPLQPPDRIRFGAPVADLIFLTRDVPKENPVTGQLVQGLECSPDPSLDICVLGVAACDPRTLYRTTSGLDDGAGPGTLRGTFAFAALTSGQIITIDVDDLDARCRLPNDLDPALGCPAGGYPGLPTSGLVTPGEASCNVVVRHEPRSSSFVLTNDASVGRHEPGIQTYPLLFAANGTVEPIEEVRMVATVPAAGGTQHVSIGSERLEVGADGRLVDDPDKHVALVQLENPRAHTADQFWTVTYEGRLPALTGRKGRLDLLEQPTDRLVDPSARFCDGGVMSKEAARAQLALEGETSDAAARALADYVEIATELLERDDVYWDTATCTYDDCNAFFGTKLQPSPERDMKILEAYQDVLLIEPPGSPDRVTCCFPGVIDYDVRVGSQWAVVGTASGLLHKVIADPASGVCRPSCESDLARISGRVRSSPEPVVVEGSPYAFASPFLKFGIVGTPEKDASFRFSTQGAFLPLSIPLQPDGATVLPQSILPVTPLGAILVADGLFEGLMVVDVATVTLSARYF